jgi:hypothetical protein
MTPKEKAIQLVDNFKFETKQSEIINDIILGDISVKFQHHKAKQCALIAINLLLDTRSFLISIQLQDYKYWENVKQEIEKL